MPEHGGPSTQPGMIPTEQGLSDVAVVGAVHVPGRGELWINPALLRPAHPTHSRLSHLRQSRAIALAARLEVDRLCPALAPARKR